MPSATPPNADRLEGVATRRASDDFVNLTAHELKNPLKALAVDAEYLAHHLQDCSDTVRRTGELAGVAESMALAARRMSEQVSDLLALAIDNRNDSGSETIDLNVLVEDVVRDFEGELRAVGGRVEVDSLPSVFASVAGLRMLLRNLISNAIRYRHPDRPAHLSIQSKTYRLDRGRRLLNLTFTDNGMGIPPSEQRRIFEPYSRAGADEDGLGLGLAICDRVVRRMGGTIHVDSDGQSGSQFSILIHDIDPTMVIDDDTPDQGRRHSDGQQEA